MTHFWGAPDSLPASTSKRLCVRNVVKELSCDGMGRTVPLSDAAVTLHAPTRPNSSRNSFNGRRRSTFDIPWIDADSLMFAAFVGSEREAQYFDCILRPPEEWAFASSKIFNPVLAGVTKTVAPVVVERVERPQFTVTVHLETWLLETPCSAAIHTGETSPSGDLPAFVIREVVRT